MGPGWVLAAWCTGTSGHFLPGRPWALPARVRALPPPPAIRRHQSHTYTRSGTQLLYQLPHSPIPAASQAHPRCPPSARRCAQPPACLR